MHPQDSGHTTPGFDLVSDANFTFCNSPKAVVCPSPNNQSCCDQGQGRSEILFLGRDPLPFGKPQMSSYYTSAGYTIPTSITKSDSTAQTPLTDGSNKTMPSTISGTSNPHTVTVSASTTSQGTLATSMPAANASAGSSGMTSGGKIGLGVGVGVGVGTAIILSAVFFYRRRRKHAKEPDIRQIEGNMPRPVAAYLGRGELHNASIKPELDARHPNHGDHELPG